MKKLITLNYEVSFEQKIFKECDSSNRIPLDWSMYLPDQRFRAKR